MLTAVSPPRQGLGPWVLHHIEALSDVIKEDPFIGANQTKISFHHLLNTVRLATSSVIGHHTADEVVGANLAATMSEAELIRFQPVLMLLQLTPFTLCQSRLQNFQS